MSKEFRIVVAVVLGVLLAYLSARILRPFYLSMGWGILLAVMLAPVRNRLERRFKSPFWPSFLSTLLGLIVVLLPVAFFIASLASEITTALPGFLDQINELEQDGVPEGSGLALLIQRVHALLEKAGVELQTATSFMAGRISAAVQGLLQNTVLFLFHLLFTVLFTYVFLRHGRMFLSLADAVIPLSPEQKGVLWPKMKGFIEAIFRGIFLTALIQGLLGTLGYWILGIPSPLFFGTLTFIMALIPVGGAALVWVPLAAYLFLGGKTAAGVILMVWGAVLVSGLDNIIRPLLIAGRAPVHPLFVLVSALGGVAAFGVIGLFYGPILLLLAREILRLAAPPAEAPSP